MTETFRSRRHLEIEALIRAALAAFDASQRRAA